MGLNYFIPCFLQLPKALNGDNQCLHGSFSVIELWIEPLIYEVLNYSRIHFLTFMPYHPESSQAQLNRPCSEIKRDSGRINLELKY